MPACGAVLKPQILVTLNVDVKDSGGTTIGNIVLCRKMTKSTSCRFSSSSSNLKQKTLECEEHEVFEGTNSKTEYTHDSEVIIAECLPWGGQISTSCGSSILC
jgi:hypothetical protein